MQEDESRFTFRLPRDVVAALPADPGQLKGEIMSLRATGSSARVEDVAADDSGLLVTMVITDPGERLPMAGGQYCYSPVTNPGPQCGSAD